MNLKTSALSAFTGAVLAASLAANAFANDSYQLRYSASDLRSPADTQELYERIQFEAKSYCGRRHDTWDLSNHRPCVRDVVSDLVSKVDHPALYAAAEKRDPALLAALEARTR